MSRTAPAVRALAALYPWSVSVSDDLEEAVAFLEYPRPASEIVRAGYAAGMVTVVPILGLAVVLPGNFLVRMIAGLAIGVAIPLGVVHAIHSAPHLFAALRRTRALGETPDLIGRAVLRMKIQPAAENAVRFAATTGHGPLAESLLDHVERSIGTPQTGIIAFAESWADRFPALRRSAHLLETAQDAPEGERARTLDRALQAVLTGTRDQMADFTATIQSATTAVFAFGIILPLALIALVPAAGVVEEINLPLWVFVLIYNFILPVGLIVVSAWLLSRRPVAFPPPDVTRAHPDVPDRLWPAAVTAVAGGGAAGVFTLIVAPAYLVPIAVLGVGLGGGLMIYYKPILEVRNYVREVEEHLVDALYLVGRRVSEKEAVESAIAHAGDRIPGETGVVFEDAAGVQGRLHLSVEEAFLGEYGALRDVPSSRARSTASLLAIAADEGHPAGRAIVSMADHLEELQEVEDRTRRQLETVTNRLENTAALFGPLIAGATVGMSAGIAERISGTGQGTPMPTDQLGIVVGLFVITLCLILVPLSLALQYGLDRSLIGYHVGRALLMGVPLYVVAIVAVGTLM